MHRIALVAGLALALVGCADVESSEVMTSGMWAKMAVSADGSGGSRATAVLKVGGSDSNTYVELVGDDDLTCTLMEDARTMSEQQVGDYHQYVVTFDSAPVGEPYVISLVRSVDDGAPATVIELPEPFDLEEPAIEYSRSSDITIRWSPSGTDDFIMVAVEGDCILPWSTELETDPGELTIPAGTLQPVDDQLEESCQVAYRVARWNNGELDPGFGEGGRATGRQEREMRVLTTP